MQYIYIHIKRLIDVWFNDEINYCKYLFSEVVCFISISCNDEESRDKSI